MKTILMLIVALTTLSGSLANAASKADVWDLLQRIDGELRYYNQSPESLNQVHGRLEEALRILRGSPIANPQACSDFAYGEYKKEGFSNATAMDKARVFCSKVSEAGTTLVVINFFYENLKKDGYSNSTSLQHSIELGAKVSEQKLGCVRTAFERYSQDGFSKRTSLQRAVDFCAI